MDAIDLAAGGDGPDAGAWSDVCQTDAVDAARAIGGGDRDLELERVSRGRDGAGVGCFVERGVIDLGGCVRVSVVCARGAWATVEASTIGRGDADGGRAVWMGVAVVCGVVDLQHVLFRS